MEVLLTNGVGNIYKHLPIPEVTLEIVDEGGITSFFEVVIGPISIKLKSGGIKVCQALIFYLCRYFLKSLSRSEDEI